MVTSASPGETPAMVTLFRRSDDRIIGGGCGEGQPAAAGVLETGIDHLLIAYEDLLLGDGITTIRSGDPLRRPRRAGPQQG